jgi:hypothetical protein
MVFRGHAEHVGRFMRALGGADLAGAGEALRHWAPQLAGHSASRAIGTLAAQALALLDSPALARACDDGLDPAHEARRMLERLAALGQRTGDVRRLEDAVAAFGALGAAGWHGVLTDLLKRLKPF